ncbi:MAG: hypothetical protein EA378_08895 [Phycisphaerales bacterium]|nr:MAG: hypothetical protein EA378_08895 [Phycisphaerales bacterium]
MSQPEPLACPDCQSQKLRGLYARDPTAAPVVFIACAACETLIASFRLDHAFLNATEPEAVAAMLGNRAFESGRELTENLDTLRAEAQQRYDAARAQDDPADANSNNITPGEAPDA